MDRIVAAPNTARAYPHWPTLLRIHATVRASLQQHYILQPQSQDRSYQLFCLGIELGSNNALWTPLGDNPQAGRCISGGDFSMPPLDAQYAHSLCLSGVRLGQSAIALPPLFPLREAQKTCTPRVYNA